MPTASASNAIHFAVSAANALPEMLEKSLPSIRALHRFVPSTDPILEELKSEDSGWKRFLRRFHYSTRIEDDIAVVSQLNDVSNHWKDHLKSILTALDSAEYQNLKPKLRVILKRLSRAQWTDLFNRIVCKSYKNNAMTLVSNFLALVTVEELENMLRSFIQAQGVAVDDSIEISAECAKGQQEAESLASKQSEKSALYKLFHGLMDTILMAFSFFEIGKEPASSWDASYLIKVYGSLLGLPLTIFTALAVLCSPLTAILVTVGIIGALVLFLIAYIKWWKPCPENLESCINLTSEALKGNIAPVLARDNEINQVINALVSSNTGYRSHPLLCGPSGVGKSEIVRGLALRIAQGNVPKALLGKKVFLINTAQLLENQTSYGPDKLERLISRISKYKDDCIIFFDEIHAAMQKKSLATRLKTILNDLTNCIAATTDEEYKRYFDGERSGAFKRRFKRINVAPTDNQQTVQILRAFAVREAADLNVSNDLLNKIYLSTSSEVPSRCQPDISIHILANAISKVRLSESDGHQSKELQQLKIEAQSYVSLMSAHPADAHRLAWLQKLNAVRLQIKAEEAKSEQGRERIQKYLKLKKLYVEKTQELSRLAKILHESDKKSSNVTAQRKLYLFSQFFMLPYLEKLINRWMYRYHDQLLQIDAPMIEQLVAEAKKANAASGE